MADAFAAVRRTAKIATAQPRARALDRETPPTHERIILAAERLFAEFGIANVSLRDIAAAAGQKNNVAVQYHFGDRENLLRQIVVYRIGSHAFLVERTTRRLQNVDTPITPYDIVSDYFEFLTQNIVEGNYFLPFLSRLMTERGGLSGMASAVPPDVSNFLRLAVREALPDFSDDVIDRRWTVMTSSAVHSLASYQMKYSRLTATDMPLDDMVEDLVRFFAGALIAAPAPRKTSSGSRSA